ncbi:hypothetical protein CUC44_09405 [Aeromonas lusitana]|uniref:Uncharacterized protein n=1 Tax=Aeromonas lusitana TaxID=931529 RepID=A0A2M8HA61_9GAMM|nr:hypothetical protein CUC44_09405 [Aeromonas lusitana]
MTPNKSFKADAFDAALTPIKNQDIHLSEQGAVLPAHKKMDVHIFLQTSEMQINITKHLSLDSADGNFYHLGFCSVARTLKFDFV